MASSLFPKHNRQETTNPMLQQFEQVKNMVGGNPQAFVNALASQNPSFAQFLQNNAGKSIDQIGKEVGQQQGFDFGQLRKTIGR